MRLLLHVMLEKSGQVDDVRVRIVAIVGRVSQLFEVKLRHDSMLLPMTVGHVKTAEQVTKLMHLLFVVLVQVLPQQQ